jgi:hypothetical protein
MFIADATTIEAATVGTTKATHEYSHPLPCQDLIILHL